MRLNIMQFLIRFNSEEAPLTCLTFIVNGLGFISRTLESGLSCGLDVGLLTLNVIRRVQQLLTC